VRFSARIDSSDEIPGLPDMGELSLEGAESAKQIAARLQARSDATLSLPFRCVPLHSAALVVGQKRSLVLGFCVWHFFHLSGGPILEEEIYV
jgi:hypothetical protein